jgi:hypothetical protein
MLEMLSIRSTGALKHRGIKGPGAFSRGRLFPLVVLTTLLNRTLFIIPKSLARPYTLREVWPMALGLNKYHHHHHHHHHQQKDYLPLRLLDVQDGVADAVQLVSTSQFEPGSTPTYCALSHCWGGTVDFKLTGNELDQMQSLQMNLLPRNFQHAIAITRQLGVCYLWIDSLCIIQDDTGEWEAQSAKMGLVYANAKCVISATASKNSTGCCFVPRALRYDDCVLYESRTTALVAAALIIGSTNAGR